MGYVQFSSVAQLCLTLCDHMDCSIPGLTVLHQLLKLAQSHVHQVADAIQPSHPKWHLKQVGLFSSCLQTFPATGYFLMSLFFTSVSHNIGASGSASALPMNIQYQFSLALTAWVSLQSKWLSRLLSIITVQKHQFFIAHNFLWSNSQIHTWQLGKIIALIIQNFFSKVMSVFKNVV